MIQNKFVARCIVLMIPIALLSPLAIWFYPTFKIWSTFTEEQLSEYEALLVRGSGTIEPRATIPYKTGKAVLVIPSVYRIGQHNRYRTHTTQVERESAKQIEPPRLHSAMYHLDSFHGAGHPDEVETVVFCEPTTVKLVDEENIDTPDRVARRESVAGQRRDVIIKSFDLKTRRFLGAYVIKGPEPELKNGKYRSPEEPDILTVVAQLQLTEL